jgi:NADH-quinone oxidoreductase subunit M
MLWMFQRVMFGPIKNEENKKLKDLNVREMFVLAPLLVMIFVMGIFPNIFLSKMEPSIDRFLSRSLGVTQTTPTAMSTAFNTVTPEKGTQ